MTLRVGCLLNQAAEPYAGVWWPAALLAVPVMSALAQASCGYALVGSGTLSLPEDVKKIAVVQVQGRLPRADYQQLLTQSLVDEMVKRTGRDISTQQAGADAVLETEVQSFRVIPTGWDNQQRITQFQVTMVMSLVLHRTSGNEVLFKVQGWTFRTQFEIEPLATTDSVDRELIALQQIGDDIARAAVSAMLEGF